jgi:hypothetical protein
MVSNFTGWQNFVPGNVGRYIVVGPACQCAVIAAFTFRLIDHHGPLVRPFFSAAGSFRFAHRAGSTKGGSAEGGNF